VIQSTYGNIGKFEVAVPRPDSVLPSTGAQMTRRIFFRKGQETFGLDSGNFEFIALRAERGFSDCGRDNNHIELPWIGPCNFAVDAGIIDSVSMIQSNFSQPGNLEMVAHSEDQLFFIWRGPDSDFT
jgi:hypothetical protein